MHLIGQPRFPVVLTAIADDTVGAGLRPDGMPQTDTNNDGDFREMVDGGGIFCPPATGTALTVTGTTIDGDALRDAMLGDGIIPVGNATYIGGATSSGFFQNGNAIGMACGIVLSTGDADTASGPNLSDSSSAVSSGLPDAQLDALYTTNTQDTTSLEFQFISQGGNLFFNYVFASEEYNEFANSTFNDVFAFFLDGVNIALIPGTTTPVTINNINGGNPLGTNPMNPQLYNNNDPGDAGGFLAEFGYDGFTDVLTATTLNLSPGVHTIRLVVSDVTDTAFDSAVFLQMGSFSDEPPAAPPAPGAWDGVTLDTYSHDRNIATVAEAESRSGQVPGANANPLTAQYIGELAPNEKGGDESRRLGFTVHGLLSQPGDVDTYSFKAAAGTEVWLDIDRTGMGLDSVVELVTADGLIQALSNDSLAEEQAGEVA
ncbi:MAG: choice-of-anchor L domain-containing protein, partial [Planctomycetales bacterium]|nr:choice-of-anchor L domain-containing protein [Planctomycetales bacterium]